MQNAAIYMKHWLHLPFDNLSLEPVPIWSDICIRLIFVILFEIGKKVLNDPRVQLEGTGWKNILYPCNGTVCNCQKTNKYYVLLCAMWNYATIKNM